jgi:type I restriction enzyme R subunit
MRTQKIERRFMGLVKRLKAAYDVCCGSEALSQPERDHIHFYLAVRSIVFKLTKGDAPDVTQMNARVREMISDALKQMAWKSCFSWAMKANRSIFSTRIIWRVLIRSSCPQQRSSFCRNCWRKPSATLKKINQLQGINFTRRFQSIMDNITSAGKTTC